MKEVAKLDLSLKFVQDEERIVLDLSALDINLSLTDPDPVFSQAQISALTQQCSRYILRICQALSQAPQNS